MPLLRSLQYREMRQGYKYFVLRDLRKYLASTGLLEIVRPKQTLQADAAGECNLLEVLQNKSLWRSSVRSSQAYSQNLWK